MNKSLAQWAGFVALCLFVVGGVAVAASSMLFRDCNNCTVNVPPEIVQEAPPIEQLGSVGRTGEYHASSTSASTITKEIYFTTSTASLNDTQAGTLGSFILAGPVSGNGSVDFYDATTTNPTQRLSTMTTNTILMASIPTQNATGTYTFDIVYQFGLIAVFKGTIPTSTVTWR